MLTIQSQIEEIPVERDGSIPEAVISSTQPYVLRGLVKNWPMVKAAQDSAKQAVDYLSQFSTDEPLTVYRGDASIDGRVFYNEDFSHLKPNSYQLEIENFVNNLKQGKKCSPDIDDALELMKMIDFIYKN